jgi:hypothetical protein
MSGTITPLPDLAGNTAAASRAVGPLSGTAQVFRDYVGLGDPYDYYAVTVTTNSIVDLSFVADTPAGLYPGKSGLALYAANGTTQIAFADFATTTTTGAAQIKKALGVGTYYLKVDNPTLAGAATNYTLSVLAGPTSGNVTPASITDALLPPLGSIQFIDNSLEAQAGRLYQAAFGRAPDDAGLSFWAGALHAGTPLVDIAGGFLASTEFQARYGNPDNNGFVNSLYQNVLGRPADAAGLAFWVGSLESGAQTRPQVLASFSESNENKANTAPSTNAQSAARLYWAELGRAPDSAGLTFWTGQLSNGVASLSQEADALASSTEFTTRYGGLDDTGFVRQLYLNVLGREADPAGLATWTGVLASGSPRGSVVIGFSESTEAKARFDFLDGKFGIVALP